MKSPQIVTRQSSLESLANEISCSKEKLFQSIKGNIKHEKHELTRERCYNIVNFYLDRNFEISN